MKKSVNYWMVGGFEGKTPVVEAARRAKSMGYDAIELCFGAGELTPESSLESLGELRQGIEGVGIEIASLATGSYWGMSLGAADEAERQAAVAFSEAYLKAARAFGVDAVLVVPGTVDVPFDPSRPVVPAGVVYENAAASIKALLPVASGEGVALCLENVWSKFLTGPFEYRDFIASFASPFVGAYFDVGNCLINGYPEHYIPLLGEAIKRVHFKNFRRCDGGGSLGDFTGSLLEGDLNWPAVFRALKGIGYDGYVTAEVIVGESGMPNLGQSEKVCQEMAQLIAAHSA